MPKGPGAAQRPQRPSARRTALAQREEPESPGSAPLARASTHQVRTAEGREGGSMSGRAAVPEGPGTSRGAPAVREARRAAVASGGGGGGRAGQSAGSRGEGATKAAGGAP